MDKPLIFLSHAGEDSQPAKELARHLGQAGLEVWLDVERVKPGHRWMEEIEKGLKQARAFVLYVGKSGVRNWVDQEVRVALDRSTKEQDFRLIPVLGPDSKPDELPLFLKQYQWLDLRKGLTEAAQLRALIEGATERPAEGVSLLPPDKPPFRGLEVFDVEDSLLFFGRDAEIQELMAKLRVDSFLAVVGDSGSGKSSLVRAGLIPALHRGRFHDGKGWVESWRVAIARPGEDPFGELAKALLDLNPQMPAGEETDSLEGRKEKLARQQDGLDNAIAALVPRGSRTLLVVDQFEELFTLTTKVEDRRRFIDALFTTTKTETERPVCVVITLRADFYSHCWEHARLTAQMGANQYTVRRASSERLREVIEKPLARSGARAEPGLVDVILSDVGDEPGNLPLLEHALLQLWDRREGQTITHKAYNDIGQLSGALMNHADDVLRNLGKENEDLVRKILLHLTQLGEDAKDTRRRVKKADLLGLHSGKGDVEKVLQALTDERLVVVGKGTEGGGGDAMAEVAHEALIRDWPKLCGWLKESRDSLRYGRRLTEKAKEWDSSTPKRHPNGLLRGEMLEEALKWAREQKTVAPATVQEFLAAGLEDIIYVDPESGLMWTRKDNGEDINWDEANRYAANLRLGGYSDWRLPTIEELQKLSNPQRGAYKIRKPLQLTAWWVWSSTKESSDSAWFFNFFYGKHDPALLGTSSGNRALYVRRPGE